MDKIDLITFLILLFFTGLTVVVVLESFRRYRINKRIKELEVQKCKGPHSWIYMVVDGPATNVCKDCCYSPAYDGYVGRLFVELEIQRKIFNDELNVYIEERLKEIGTEYDLNEDEVKDIKERISKIRKDFVNEKYKTIDENVSGE